ncbi:hypothetical protein SZN_09341 [Streptomyces zinciresistens K42]|uniref:Uncharacterized protein n=1 Tax=Streptomyces zinciresistens K42 TaxID=700597 RepID=G2G8Q0_9ACTN|nr:hypothetical protein [Streptomyces zinciresistens]EGX60115.1 hypothetical protein SZN_09341 [Streptomyces zinciresistens K42]
MILALLLAAALVPGAATVWLLRHHGWALACTAGAAVTLSLPGLALLLAVLFPPLGIAAALASTTAALRAYDDGRIWAGTAWAGTAGLALTCAAVAL